MGIYVDILPLLPVLPDVATVLGIEPLTVLWWGLPVLLYLADRLFGGILEWLAVDRLAKPLLSRWRRSSEPGADREIREREAELQREIGRLESRLEAAEEALQRERTARENSDRRAERHKAELEEKRRPWWRKLLDR